MPRVTILTLDSQTSNLETLVLSLTYPTSFTQFGAIYIYIYTFYLKHMFETGFRIILESKLVRPTMCYCFLFRS